MKDQWLRGFHFLRTYSGSIDPLRLGYSRGKAWRRRHPPANHQHEIVPARIDGITDQERTHFITPVIEDTALPVRVKSLDAGRHDQIRCVPSKSAKDHEHLSGKCDGTQSRITPMPAWWSLSTRYLKSCGVPKRLVIAKVACNLITPAGESKGVPLLAKTPHA